MNILFLFPLLVCAAFAVPVKYDQRQDGDINVRADLQNFVILALVPKLDGAGTALLNALSKTLPDRDGFKTFQIRKHINDPETDPELDIDNPNARNEPFVGNKNPPYHVDISKVKSNLAKLYPDENKANIPESRSAPVKRRVTAASAPLKLAKNPGVSVESPVPDILPVKNNRYVTVNEKKGRHLDDKNLINETEVSENENVSVVKPRSTTEDFVDLYKIRSSLDSGLVLIGATEQCGPDRYRDPEGICRFIPGVEDML